MEKKKNEDLDEQLFLSLAKQILDSDPHQLEKWDPDLHQLEKWDPNQNILDPSHCSKTIG